MICRTEEYRICSALLDLVVVFDVCFVLSVKILCDSVSRCSQNSADVREICTPIFSAVGSRLRVLLQKSKGATQDWNQDELLVDPSRSRKEL